MSCSMRLYGRTDRHAEANSRLPQFYEGAKKTSDYLSNTTYTFTHSRNSYKFRLVNQAIYRLYEILREITMYKSASYYTLL